MLGIPFVDSYTSLWPDIQSVKVRKRTTVSQKLPGDVDS